MNPSSARSGFLSRGVAVALLAGFGAVDHARAHAFLERAEPAVGGAVRAAPAEVRVRFTEAVEVAFSSLKVFDASGKEVDRKDVHADPQDRCRLCVSLPGSLGAGTYRVAWRVVSVDTHVTQGEFAFRVEPSAR